MMLTEKRGFGYGGGVAAESATGFGDPNTQGGCTASLLIGGLFVSGIRHCFLGRLYGRPQGLPAPWVRFANLYSLPFLFGDRKGGFQKKGIAFHDPPLQPPQGAML